MNYNILSAKDFSAKINEEPKNDTLKLYAVVLGGRAPKCNIELHDIVFVIGVSLKSCINRIIDKWFGIEKGLHIDAFVQLQSIDGYDIKIIKNKNLDENDKSLYFLNFGGYTEDYFGETHRNIFIVADSAGEAKRLACKKIDMKWDKGHCDDNICLTFEEDDILKIDELDGFHIEVVKSDYIVPLTSYMGYGCITRLYNDR
ncbi:Domain of unknown function DUF1543 [Orpheovirus IHUMI-LCC2]|uniref:DUF1543 domain-containing protein n=1 Tax=Orpheovirus IHUMI-LCC2 TaxID=2023057 RepID=A0A2I2L4Z6_9VIRU|nr:Domain of unknown function DUF1543 [Orpheovirus IHUMI-LCC2]SNW62597.1 Domain of unknown function DUF1543 [Orpheovirus IHUMI-LCC2]